MKVHDDDTLYRIVADAVHELVANLISKCNFI